MTIRKYIISVNVTGHASPQYYQQYIDPESEDWKAYSHNLDLSLKRAQQVGYFIFSEDIGKYPYKRELRDITKISGRGYMSPILSKGESSPEKCGPYNCRKSRRVEINFSLKDEFDDGDNK